MKIHHLVSLITALAVTVVCVLAGSVQAADPKVTNLNEIMYLEVTGSPYECGLQQGTALRSEIRQSVSDYKTNVTSVFGETNGKKIIDWALKQAELQNEIHKFVPTALEEAKGIAKGSGIPVAEVLLLGMYQETYQTAPQKLGIELDADSTLGHGCTAFTAQSGSTHFSGQNLDFSANRQGKQIVVNAHFINADRPDVKMLRYGFIGGIGGIGLNNNGVSVFMTTLPQGEMREANGIGSEIVTHGLLQAKSVDDAISMLKSLPRSSSLSYTLTDFNKSVIVEASASEMSIREVTNRQPFLVQTNHIVDLKKRSDMPGLFENGEPVPGTICLSAERKIFAEKMIGENISDTTLNDMKSLLTWTPVNIFNPKFMTLQSAIVEYKGQTATLHVSAGFNPLRSWNQYSFTAAPSVTLAK